jgi:hypothetical protein
MQNTMLTLTLTPGQGCFYVRDPAQRRQAATIAAGAAALPPLIALQCGWQRFQSNTCEVRGGELRVYIPEAAMLTDAEGVEHRGMWMQLHEGTLLDSDEYYSTAYNIEIITDKEINQLF